MSVFGAAAYDDHEAVFHVRDRASDLTAIVAIHDTTLGNAGGGVRMWPYASEDEALRDVLRLSRAMTYKHAFADTGYGGGKIVILGHPVRDKTEIKLRALGRFVESLGGRYVMGPDVGITLDDLLVLRRETAHVRGLPGESGDTSLPTAFGVFRGIQAAVKFRLGRDDLSGVRVAVQGAGAVGRELCRLLRGDSAGLVVADVDPDAVSRIVEAHGATAVAPDAIYQQEVDVFAPCALGGVIDDATVPRLKASIVAGGANNPLSEPYHARELAARGVLYAPDYVINAGGAINATREGPGYDRDEAYAKIAAIYDTLLEIFERAEAGGASTLETADRIAEEKIGRA